MDLYREKLSWRLASIVETYKDKVAYVMVDREVTYAQMDEMANLIASGVVRLVEKHPLKQDVPVRIGISLDRNEHYVPCILAAMKLGCSYVPIDVETPADRRDFISRDAELSVLITSENLDELLVSPLMEELPKLNSGVSEAYMIYTSGTTGRPKGVSVPYKALYSFLQAVCRPDIFHVSESSVILQFASISFDVSVLEIFSSLYYGGTLVIAQNDQRHDATLLQKLIREQKITFTLLPPSLLAVFLDYDFPAMDTLATGAEAVPENLTRMIVGKYSYRFVIAYGPTESCVAVTGLEVRSVNEWQSIGYPFPGVVCYVADADGKLVRPGEEGELLISGEQLANGYWNRPDLNAQMFFENPYEKEHDGIDVSRLYHSGDLVTLNEDGSFNYIGRKDSQIKLHGYRIELGEICTLIERQEGVLRAFVRLEEIGTEKYIVAYVRTADDIDNLNQIKQNVARLLPEYMVPTFWNQVEDFKLNINGKIDKASLVNRALDPVITNDTPLTPHEELLMQATATMLGLPSVNVEADLFNDLGITSLHVMQLTVQMGMSGFHLTANDFYTLRTIRKVMAAEQHPNAFWFGDSGADPDKPVIIVISGFTSFSFIFGEWAERLSHKFAIFAIESYHTIMEDRLTDINGLVDEYVKLVKDVVDTRNVVAITGFCAGGEQGLALAARLYNDKVHKPHVIVLDGELDRDISLQQKMRALYFFPFYNEARNNARTDLDINLMATMPEETYNGRVTAFISSIYTEGSAVNTGIEKSPEVKKMEKEEFFTNEQRWKNRYPECEVIQHPTDHNGFLITRESKDILVDYFLKNV